jgi:hypothetical protein
MNLRMKKEFGQRLAGRLPGKRDYARLCDLLSDAPPGTIVYLDFADIVDISGSWINAALVPLLTWAADERNDLFPTLCNVKEELLDELGLVAKFTHTCFLVATGSIPPRRATLIGPLDAGQQSTLDALLEFQAATGAELKRQKSAEKIEATAWNNRLKDLYQKRLLRRESRGREQVYSPIVKEIVHHG